MRQVNKNGKWRHWTLCVIIAGGSALGAWLVGGLRFFQILRLKAYDAQFMVSDVLGMRPAIPNIVLVLADQKTLNSFTDLRMFWHQHYANVIRAAGSAGAKVIGLDLAFGIPVDKYEPDYDRVLGDAVSTSRVPVVSGYATELDTDPQAQRIPINMLSASLGLAGFANLTSDSDEVVRRQELIEPPPLNSGDPPPAHSLALRITEKLAGRDAEWKKGKLIFKGQAIPIATDRSMAINYAGPPGTFPRVSLAEFEAAANAGYTAQLRAWVNGKIVLIGTDSRDDGHDTPFSTVFYGDKWGTPGVEIHANTISTLVERKFLEPVAPWMEWLALLLATGVTVLIATELAAWRAVAFVLLEVAAVLVCTHLLFEGGFILSTSDPLLATSLCLVGSVFYRFNMANQSNPVLDPVPVPVAARIEFSQTTPEPEPVTVHVLFMDIVKSSQLSADAQHRTNARLKEVVVNTHEFQAARARGELISLPTGDGMALVFRQRFEAPLLCAIEIARTLQTDRFCHLRMGIHSGVVFLQHDINDNPNVTGPGINLAERVMSCGEEGHILVSGEAAELLRHLSIWGGKLGYLGEYQAKRDGVRVWNFLDGDIGSSAPLTATPRTHSGDSPARL